LHRREVRKQVVCLEDRAHGATITDQAGLGGWQGLAVEGDGAGHRHVEAGEDPQQRRLSATYSTLESYLPLAVGYLILTLPLSGLSRWLERRFRYEAA